MTEVVDNTQQSNKEITGTPANGDQELSVFEIARRKHEARAKRFGVEFHEPKLELFDKKPIKRYKNKRGTAFITGFDLASEEEQQRKEERAKKFGLEVPSTENQVEEDAIVDEAQEGGGMDIDLQEEKKDVDTFLKRRLDTIHVYGTDNMSTNDVFSIFTDYGPDFAEWINDSSCNVVFKDVHTARRALEGLSKPLPALPETSPLKAPAESSSPSAETAEDAAAPVDNATVSSPADAVVDVEKDSVPVSSSSVANGPYSDMALYGWRKGLVSWHEQTLLMRYATVEDSKDDHVRPSAYYRRLRRQNAGYEHGSNNGQQTGKRARNPKRKRNRRSKRKIDDVEMQDADGDRESIFKEITAEEQERRNKRRQRFFNVPDESHTTIPIPIPQVPVDADVAPRREPKQTEDHDIAE